MKRFIPLITLLALIFSCEKKGCKDPDAFNYNFNPKVIDDPASCIYPSFGIHTIRINSGNIDTPTTWSKTESEVNYLVNCHIKINDVLTIEPGVVVEFTEEGSLELMDGKLIAIGDSQNKIKLFTKLKINDEINTNDRILNLKHVNLKGISIVDNCEIILENINISGPFKVVDIDNEADISNIIVSNNNSSSWEYPVTTNKGEFNKHFDQFTLINNTNNMFKIQTVYGDNNLNTSGGIFTDNYPVYFENVYTEIIDLSDLYAEPGCVFLINNQKRLKISGEVECNGTENNPIIFKAKNLNWKGLIIYSQNEPSFNYVEIQDIAYSVEPVYVSLNLTNSLTMTNCIINGNQASCGIEYSNIVDEVTPTYNIEGTVFNGCDENVCY